MEHRNVVLSTDTGQDHTRRLHRRGPVVEVELPGQVVAWAVTTHAAMLEVVSHPDIKKNPVHWRSWTEGRIPSDWDLITFVDIDSMFTADDADHARMRTLLSRAFTPRRVSALAPRIDGIVTDLLAGMAEEGGGARVDLKSALALPLPITVISELFGVESAADRRELHRLISTVFDHSVSPEVAARTHAELPEFLSGVVAARRERPGDDLTSALIAARDDDDRLDENELVWMLALMIGAGFETTMNLITNAARALLTHPAQLARLADETHAWSAAVEETLRWDPPIVNLPFRYTAADVTVAGARIPAGEPLLMCHGSAGRDPAQHGDTADVFDVARVQQPHLAFGHGPHFCLGSHLARLEAETALRRLFTHFPDLTLAVPADELRDEPSLVGGGVIELPVTPEPARSPVRS